MKTKNKTSLLDSRILYIIYPIVSFLLVSQWFSSHTLLANAEQGLHLYDLQRTFSVYSHIWLNIGLGIASPFYVPRIPYYALLMAISSWGIANWLIQASVYFIVLTIGIFSVNQLVALLCKEEKKYIPHISAAFYLFNLYVMSQILIRFLDALLFVWAFLPLFLLLWIYWIKTVKVIYLIALLISTFVFSALFSLVVSVILIWIPACVYSAVALFIEKDKRKVLLASVSGLLIWIIGNLWWLLPVLNLRDNSYAELKNSSGSLTSLSEVTQYYKLSDILFLRQEYYFSNNGPWSGMYSAHKYLAISYALLFFCVVGIINSIKQKKQQFLLVLLLIAFFLVKGTNPPFGNEIYSFMFNHFPFSQILRNPYEKVGLLFILPYIIFVSIGIAFIASMFKKFEYIFVIFVVIIGSVYLLKPMFNKDFFSAYRVTVPNYYATANTYIKKKSSDRIFHLPFLNDSNVHYEWGYIGEEPSEFLFDNNSLAKTSHIPSLDEYYLTLEKYLPQKNFLKLLALVNINTIVMHNEFVTEKNKPDLNGQANSYLATWSDLSPKKQIGKLDIYWIENYKLPGEIYSVDKAVTVSSIEKGYDAVLTKDFDIDSEVFIYKKDMIPRLKSLQKPRLQFKKENNETYHVKINNAQKPFLLVFSSSYNPEWQANIGHAAINTHIKVNGYANAWLINKKGSYDINVEFNP